MDSAIISSIISAGSVVLSALISYGVAKMTTQKETEKLKTQQKLLDAAERKDAFSAMVKAVDAYIMQISQEGYAPNQAETAQAISVARVLFSGPIADAIDDLQIAFDGSAKLTVLRRCLNKAVDEYRRHKDDSP